jgi:hypothetical protein
MRKKVIYLGVGFVILGLIFLITGIFILSDSSLFLTGNYNAISTVFQIRSFMNWLGIIFSIGGAVAIIIGVYLDEEVQFKTAKMDHSIQPKEENYIRKETSEQAGKINFCFHCGVQLEGTPKYCYDCGTELR